MSFKEKPTGDCFRLIWECPVADTIDAIIPSQAQDKDETFKEVLTYFNRRNIYKLNVSASVFALERRERTNNPTEILLNQ